MYLVLRSLESFNCLIRFKATGGGGGGGGGWGVEGSKGNFDILRYVVGFPSLDIAC